MNEQVQTERELTGGERAKDLTYGSHRTYGDERLAAEAFPCSVTKLFDVAGWSSLGILSADFALYDSAGRDKPAGGVDTGDFVRITLPGPVPENWVRVIYTFRDDKRAEFTVQPCPDPMTDKPDQIDHFFDQQARSTFRVMRDGCTISAVEMGQHEAINNQQPQAGERAFINTLIAEAGWLFYQKIQWKLLTDYLVHG